MLSHSHDLALAGLSRRQCLHLVGLGAGNLALASLPSVSSALATTPATGALSSNPLKTVSHGLSFGKAKSVILFWLNGGPPQHETWDPKPLAPVEIRGPFGSIETNTPGLRVGELMPMTAKLTDKIAVLRAVVTDDNAHSSSGYSMLTGIPHIPPNAESVTAKSPNLAPCVDSIVRRLRPSRNGLPASVVLPEHVWNDGNFPWPGQDGGFLGHKFDPWLIHCDPSVADFKVPDLAFPEQISGHRFESRRQLLESINGRMLDVSDRSASMRAFSEDAGQAIHLLSASAGRKAFDLSQESDSIRDRYGRSRYSQSVLLARRLVEAGASIVRINWTRIKDKPNQGGWDTHSAHAPACKDLLMPMMDLAYSALIEDLDQRGLLDSTLVVWIGEFGRTPRFNSNGGRDHWGKVFSIALAGGGIRGGVVHGESDKDAAFPASGRVEPRDFTATLFHCLGYSAETEIQDTIGRPFPISRGEVIHEIC